MKEYLKHKYSLKYIPDIYISRRISAASLPSYSLFKSNKIAYNPDVFSNSQELEFVLLHELGHSQHKFINTLRIWIRAGIRPSIILGVFLNVMSIKYGIVGFLLAPRLFDACFFRFFEEPHADDIAIRYASKDPAILQAGKDFFSKQKNARKSILRDNGINPLTRLLIADYDHPLLSSRIRKIQNAIDGHPNYFRATRFLVLLLVIKEAVELAFAYHSDANSLQEGLEKIKEIENNPETYCYKFEIPKEGQLMYLHALEQVKKYFETKLKTLNENKERFFDEEDAILIGLSKDEFNNE